MSKTWKLLTKEEIKALSQGDLEDYLSWLKQYKQEKIDELTKKKAMLNKIMNKDHDMKTKERLKKDKEEIEKIRKEINNII